MLNLELVTYVYESEVCMRGNMLKGTHGRMNGQFYSLFHRDDTWPKFLVFVIIIFYATIFALFALSYTYIFSGLWGSGSGHLPVRIVGDQVNVLKDATLLPKDLTASLDTNVVETITANKITPNTAKARVQINGVSVPVPDNGSVHKDISTATNNGSASLDVNIQSNGSSNSESTSTVDLNVSSSSNTVSESRQ